MTHFCDLELALETGQLLQRRDAATLQFAERRKNLKDCLQPVPLALRNIKMPLNPANFPRPPLLERITKHLQVKWPSGEVIADSRNAYWVLETHHPPSEICDGAHAIA